ncbi:Uncharacterised protein [Mycobacteroides abscessus subsp. abscessus]|nr:Uncharacterised protein [Mycobacteroides abscessus subsp. abscessus]
MLTDAIAIHRALAPGEARAGGHLESQIRVSPCLFGSDCDGVLQDPALIPEVMFVHNAFGNIEELVMFPEGPHAYIRANPLCGAEADECLLLLQRQEARAGGRAAERVVVGLVEREIPGKTRTSGAHRQAVEAQHVVIQFQGLAREPAQPGGELVL